MIEHSTAKSVFDRVINIKASFGLSITQLAVVLNVQRQTIYDWMDEENPPKAQRNKLIRILKIERLAEEWNSLCKYPFGEEIESVSICGQNLLELLSSDDIDEESVCELMRSFAEYVNEKWRRMEEKSIGESFLSNGFKKIPNQSLRSVLSGICGGTVSFDG